MARPCSHRPPVRRRAAAPLPQRTLGVWMDTDTQLVLWREEYPRRVGLTVAALAAEPALQAAIAEGARRIAEGDPPAPTGRAGRGRNGHQGARRANPTGEQGRGSNLDR